MNRNTGRISERVPSAETSVPLELGCLTLSHFHYAGVSTDLEVHATGTLWRLLHIGMINL